MVNYRKVFMFLAVAGMASQLSAQDMVQGKNVNVNPTSSIEDGRIEGKLEPGMGKVVFYRIARHADGYGSSCKIMEGEGDAISKLPNIKGNSYLAVDTVPGIHRYSVKIETTDHLTLEVEEGEIYFVQCVMAYGVLRARPDIRPSTREEFLSFAKLKPMPPIGSSE